MWPHDEPVTNSAHEVVQRFARQLELHVRRTSASDVARKSNVPVSTVADVVLGTTEHTALTVAKLEHGVGRHLWCGNKQKTRIRPQ